MDEKGPRTLLLWPDTEEGAREAYRFAETHGLSKDSRYIPYIDGRLPGYMTIELPADQFTIAWLKAGQSKRIA